MSSVLSLTVWPIPASPTLDSVVSAAPLNFHTAAVVHKSLLLEVPNRGAVLC